MIKIEIYADTAADVRKQMLELLNLEASQTIAIQISPEATVPEVKEQIKAAETKAKATKAKPDAAVVAYDPKLSNTAQPAEARAPTPDAPPWIDTALQPPEAHVEPEQLPLEKEVPVTASALREALGEVSEKKGRDALTKLLATFGVKQFSKLMPNDYPAAWQAAQGLLK